MNIDWGQLLISIIPALAAIAAAVIAAKSARRAQTAEAETARLRQLEERLSAKKYETYEPMLTLLGELLTPEDINDGSSSATKKKAANRSTAELVRGHVKFSTWISVFGSDEAVRAYERLMQASYSDPPPQVFLRLYAEFVIAARRDISYSETEIRAINVMGMRMTDAYTDARTRNCLEVNFDVLCSEVNWTPPWPIAGSAS